MNKFIQLILLVCAFSSSAFAGGSMIGSGGGGKVDAAVSGNVMTDDAQENAGSQVYFVGKKQAEIQFATNANGEKAVEMHSLRPEEISNEALEGLKKSQQTRQWEKIVVPNKMDFNKMKIMNMNHF